MELWIRSQDKETLIKIEHLDIYNSWDNWIIEECGVDLGHYKTKERALEVLDEIQDILKPKMIVNTYKVEQAELCDGTQFIQPMLDDIQIQNATSYVYQMPEE